MILDKESIYKNILEIKDREIPARNMISEYLPYRNNSDAFSYSYVSGRIISHLEKKKLPTKFTLQDLSVDVVKEVERLTIEGELGDLTNKIYFGAEGVLDKLSPLFLILNTAKGEVKVSKSSEQLANLLCALIDQSEVAVKEPSFNFIESIIVKKYRNKLENHSKQPIEILPYLPFIAETFKRDLDFICSKPQFLLDKLGDFLELYNFLYCSQLGANIRSWKSGEPQPREHFFIIDTEKCSAERRACQSYKDLRISAVNIFPMLTLVHELNTILGEDVPVIPLWQIAEELQKLSEEQQEEISEALKGYADRFSSTPDLVENGRGLKQREVPDPPSVIGGLDRIVQYTMDQFDQSRELNPSSKHEMPIKYMKPFEAEVTRHFVQARGRLGKILVINQDYLLMLTNIVIGNKEEMRLQEILNEFEQRGVYLDKLSRLSLIEFYERIGNIKRMSDSGDAVYVKSTV